jgi:hypothetical protein
MSPSVPIFASLRLGVRSLVPSSVLACPLFFRSLVCMSHSSLVATLCLASEAVTLSAQVPRDGRRFRSVPPATRLQSAFLIPPTASGPRFHRVPEQPNWRAHRPFQLKEALRSVIPHRLSFERRWLKNRRTVYSTLCPDVKAPVLTAVTSGPYTWTTCLRKICLNAAKRLI